MTARTPRRSVLALGAVGIVSAATGCAVYGDEDQAPEENENDGSAQEPTTSPAENEPDASADNDGAGDVVASTDDVEVGGGVILSDPQVVITQPNEGEFKGFSAVCTHQGCILNAVSDGTINCPCHGSRYSIEDGSVVQAAAGLSADSQDPLPEVGVSVDGSDISVTR